VVDGRHVDERPSRQRDVRRDPHPFVRDHVLRHLDDDLLPLAEKLVDGGERRLPGGRLGLAVLDVVGAVPRGGLDAGPDRLGLLVGGPEAVEVVYLVTDVGHVKKGVLLEAEIDESRLHSGQDARHPSLVDVPDDAALPPPLDLHLGDPPVLKDGHPRLAVPGGDEKLFHRLRR
jgi:hypothetical protein